MLMDRVNLVCNACYLRFSLDGLRCECPRTPSPSARAEKLPPPRSAGVSDLPMASLTERGSRPVPPDAAER